jgi:hypothetical protein
MNIELFKAYLKYAFPYALKVGFSLFIITMLLAVAKVAFTELTDPLSVVIERLIIVAVTMFAFFFTCSFIYGLYKYYIDSPFIKK